MIPGTMAGPDAKVCTGCGRAEAPKSPGLCVDCKRALLPENAWMTNGCPCNVPATPNAGLTEAEREYGALVAKEHDRVSRQGFSSADPPKIDLSARRPCKARRWVALQPNEGTDAPAWVDGLLPADRDRDDTVAEVSPTEGATAWENAQRIARLLNEDELRAGPSSRAVQATDIQRAEAWLLPVWRDLPDSTYTPTSVKLAALLAEIRRETIEACAKAIEADLARASKDRGGMTLGESCIYDICAITVRATLKGGAT